MRLRVENVHWYWGLRPCLHWIGHGGVLATFRWMFWYIRLLGGRS